MDRAEMLPSKRITVAIARFEDLLARGLHGVIESETSLEIVAHDVEHERIEVVLRAHHPRVAILDVDALSNLAEVRQLTLRHPDSRLVLLATHPTMAECAQLLAFGASACLGRRTEARDVLTAIHLASRGLQLVPRPSSESGDAPLISLAEALLRARALEAGVAYELIASRSELELIVGAARRSEPEPHVRTLTGWRRELVGDDLRDLLAGHSSVGVGPDRRLRLTPGRPPA